MVFASPRIYFYVLISFFVGILCILYIRSKDRFEKEPFTYLLLVTAWGGIWSYTISGFLYRYLTEWGIYDLNNAWGAFLVIGPVEEFSKLTALFSSYVVIRKQLNEPVDGLLYMACVALGYSLIENFYYALQAPTGGGLVLLLRILICTPVHINISAFMGLAFYFFLKNRSAYPLMIAAFCYAIFVHGIYDLLIFNGFLIVIIALMIWLLYKFAAMLLGYATAKSNFRCNLVSYLTAPPHQFLFTGPPCPICGDQKAKSTWLLFSNKIQKCDQCSNFITTTAGLRTILHHFAAAPPKSFLGRPLIIKQTRKGNTLPNCILESKDHGVWGFNLPAFSRLIEISNNRTIERIESYMGFSKAWLLSESSEQIQALESSASMP